MTRRRHADRRRASALVVILPLLLSGACGRSEPARTDSGMTGGAARRAPAGTAAQDSLPGLLAKPIDEYSGAELRALVRRLRFGGGSLHERRCRGDTGCVGQRPQRTAVRVDAVTGQTVGAMGGPPNGVVTLRALNLGGHEEARYGLRPGTHLEYYLIVLPGSDTAGTWRLEVLDTKALTHAQVATGIFVPCRHPTTRTPTDTVRASFRSCATAHAARGADGPPGAPAVADTDPLWEVCTQGCCAALPLTE